MAQKAILKNTAWSGWPSFSRSLFDMAYKLRHGESVPDGLRRVVAEELQAAIEQLDGSSAKTRDKAVHEARKAVKKVRGVLRIVRLQLGPTYRKENARLRTAGSELSALRDAGAIIGAFDSIVAKYGRELPNGLRAIRTGLVRSKREREKELEPQGVMQNASGKLNASLERLSKWPLTRDGYEAVAPGVTASYRAGRRAMKAAIADGSGDVFHLWRRRAKDHWYHVRLLEPVWTGESKERQEQLHELESALGEDHNLLVLCGVLRRRPDVFGGVKSVESFASFAAHDQNELRRQAIGLGKRLYADRPSKFESKFAELWRAWERRDAA